MITHIALYLPECTVETQNMLICTLILYLLKYKAYRTQIWTKTETRLCRMAVFQK